MWVGVGGLQGVVVVEREGQDDDIHFRNEEREKKDGIGLEGWC